MNKQQDPRLRFAKFKEKWEKKKIGEIFQVTSGTTPLRSNQNYFSKGLINWVKTTDLNNSILEKTEEKISEIALNETSLKILPQNTVFVAMYGGFNQIGRTGLLNIKATCNQALAAILPEKSQNPFYLLAYLNKSIDYWKTIAASSRKDPNITKQDVLNFNITLPTLPEQTHLGLFFHRLDSQIAESREVLEKSRQLKKAMLAKMFPANGEKIPKIRFKGFEGEWECRKFSEVAELRRGLTYSPLDISQNGIRVLRSSNIDEEYYIEKNDDVFVCERAVNIPLVQNGDILITAANGSSRLVGKHAIIQTSIPAVHGGFMLLARTENPYFLNASMSSVWYLNFIRIFVAGGNGAIGNLSIGDLNEQEILIPKNPEEQTAIGNFFRQLDETIALQSAEVEKLNQLKKGLLAAMLV